MNITKITDYIEQSKKGTYVVALAGGSASGKSYLGGMLLDWGLEHGYDTVILHQDDFAIGRKWAGKDSSPYRWDDPENYRLKEAYDVLEKFLHGKTLDFLAYTLEKHEPHEKKELAWSYSRRPLGRQLVIIEGLFSWQEPFDTIVDLKVFLEVNIWHRYVLRLQRNVHEIGVVNFQKVTEQYFTFVTRAHFGLLEPAKESADLLFTNIIDLAKLKVARGKRVVPYEYVMYFDDDIKIGLDRKGYIQIANNYGVVFHEEVSDDIIQEMMNVAEIR
ncbi:MAG: hypothetical protein ABIQ64_03490 [Candidatus Saccharimonadales bacterium]